MTAHTQYQGPFHFPAQAGKLLNRSKFLNGTYKTYWGPGRQNTTDTVYAAPQSWPAVGSPALIPRVVRYLARSPSAGSLHAQTGDLLDDFIIAGAFTNLYTSKALSGGSPYQDSVSTLLIAAPTSTDLTANNYYATDTLSMFVNSELLPVARYVFSPGVPNVSINVANVTADADSMTQAGDQSPRFHVRVYFHSLFSTAAPGTTASNTYLKTLEIYSVLFPSLVNPDYYSFAGTFLNADFPTNVANDMIAFATSHYGL